MKFSFKWLKNTSSFQIDQIFKVFLQSFLPQGHSTEKQLTLYFTEKITPRIKSKQLLYTVSHQEQIIGFVLFEKWKEQNYYLAEMAILPKYQLQGLGKQLVFSIFHRVPHLRKILLVTRIDNTWAQSFYLALGFQRSLFRHPNYPDNFIGYEYSNKTLEI